MTTIPKFVFTIPSIAVAERRLGLKLGDIIEQVQSETGLALRTLRTLMAAGMAPAGPRWLMDTAAESWVEQAERQADTLILKWGTAACASAVGPDLGAFLLTLEGRPHG
jgi:hypothetical protein